MRAPARQVLPRWQLEWAPAPVPRPAVRHGRSATIIPFPGPRGPAVVTYPRSVVFPIRGPAAEREKVEAWPDSAFGRGVALAAIGLFGVALAFVG